jgi:ring-1,2-phenylacetyl-CoA epoxidase subunit PaaD
MSKETLFDEDILIISNRMESNTLTENSLVEIRQLVSAVCDPEIPVLSIVDLGILRKVEITGETIAITITPTYTGCPAMDMIAMNIKLALLEHGYKNIVVKSILSPAWTTDWMTEAGKEKLKAYGIAPPNPTQIACDTKLFAEAEAIQCPLCNCWHTKLISQFGSTACKALYQCEDCREPFDYFKCH